MNTKETIKEIQKDVKNLKLKAFQPNKGYAQAFLEYLSWENGNPKKNFETIYAKELELLNEWLEVYCSEYNCNRKEALERIIEE
ncbi:MAG: hypothetical protein PHV68_02515 [Candidatus Gastranaerophilales bacterium]|nr:hypothetical protein [Candidatus Gastranaerophilales bacterium]